jgi:hypothetical protein
MTRALGIIVAGLFLLASAPSMAASLLLSGESLRSTTLPSLILTPNGKQIDIRNLRQSIKLSGVFVEADDVVELRLSGKRLILHKSTTPYDLLITAQEFATLDLPKSVALHTPAKPWFLVGYGKSEINDTGTVVYAGKLLYEMYKPITLDLVTLSDFDSDGLTDQEETALGTDPFDDDFDNDTVLDGADNCPFDQNTDQADLDNDGQGNACDDDDDGDGLPDQYELDNNLNPLFYDDAFIDSDGDGFTNIEEFEAGTDPNSAADYPGKKNRLLQILLMLGD